MNKSTKHKLEYQRKYRLANKEKISEYQKRYRPLHRKEHCEYEKKYRNASIQSEESKIKRRLRMNKYNRDRLKDDVQFLLRARLTQRLYHAVRNNQKVGSAVRDLGCTIPELKFYLEGKFKDGMSWENQGLRGWHIDHVVPLAFFDLTDREQFLRACHYTNLQPLWAVDNIRKGNKLLYNNKSEAP